MGKRGLQPQKYVNIKWTPDFAYAIGLIVTDGCLSKDGRHIDFTSKDENLVKTFSECLKLKNKIGKKISGFTGRKDYYRIQFGDVNFYNWLLNIGLSPHKSKTIKKLKIPDKFLFDFLRGHFDGDGSIYEFWDKRWRSSYMFYIQFSSASIIHLQWLEDKIYRSAGILGSIKKTRRAYQLGYAKKGSRILFKKMFYNKNIPYLKRKFIKAQKIFKIDEMNKNRPR